MRWPGPPAAHFLAIGVALFALERAAAPSRPRPAPLPAPLLAPDRLAQLRADFTRQNGTPPSADDERALVRQAMDDEIFYREAVARGLDRDDPGIRHRLVEKARFLAVGEAPEGVDEERFYREALALHLDRDDLFVRRMLAMKMRLLVERNTDRTPPDDGVLQAWLDRHGDRYREPERTSLWHVFVASTRGATLARDAEALLARLRAGDVSPDAAARLGDPFPFGTHLRGQSARDLTKHFGEEFAAAIPGLPVGAWAGPVRSAHGLHLIRVEAREPARVSPLAAVRARVLAEVLEDRRRVRLAAALDALRMKYGVTAPAAPPADGERG